MGFGKAERGAMEDEKVVEHDPATTPQCPQKPQRGAVPAPPKNPVRSKQVPTDTSDGGCTRCKTSWSNCIKQWHRAHPTRSAAKRTVKGKKCMPTVHVAAKQPSQVPTGTSGGNCPHCKKPWLACPWKWHKKGRRMLEEHRRRNGYKDSPVMLRLLQKIREAQPKN